MAGETFEEVRVEGDEIEYCIGDLIVECPNCGNEFECSLKNFWNNIQCDNCKTHYEVQFAAVELRFKEVQKGKL